MASANVVRFPVSRIVQRNLALRCDRGLEIEAIDGELRSVERAIDALRRQHRSLILRFRAAVEKRLIGSAGV